MPYTPPAGNAVDIDFSGVGYTPPSGNAVDINFAADAAPTLPSEILVVPINGTF